MMQIEVLRVDSYDSAHLRITGWANFGDRMAELEEKADKALSVQIVDDDEEMDEEEAADLKEAEDILDRAEQELMAKLGVLPDDDDDDEWEDDDEDEDDEDPDRYIALCKTEFEEAGEWFIKDKPWEESDLGRLRAFLGRWPGLRDKVQDFVFASYRDNYDEIWEFNAFDETSRITMPKPTDRSVIEDLFRIGTFELRDGDKMVLGCVCTWDEEHGFDLVIENDETMHVVAAVELDDKSHDSDKALQRGEVKNKACAAAGLPLIRFKAQRSYDPAKIAAALEKSAR
eukprot:g14866.t1